MKSHHLLVLLALSVCSYAAKEIVTSYLNTYKHSIILRGENSLVPEEKAITALTQFADGSIEMLKAAETPPTEAEIPNSISDLKMANPAEGITMIEAPTANQLGSAVLAYPIKLPAGRKGVQPQLNIQYNSEGGNGWLGLDWALQTHAIMTETRWGVPRYNPLMETETYVINGEQLSPVAHRSNPVARTGEKQFYPRVEINFARITRHGTSPTNYWWEVIDKGGTKQFYGGTPANGVDQDAILTDASGNIAYWALTENRDPNGNFVRYRYNKVFDAGISGGNTGSNLYLSSITYTGHETTEGKYSVEFIRDRQLGETKRQDVSISARLGFKQVTADLLRKIMVKYNGQNIRSYELGYAQGAFYKTLLQSISEFDAAGTLFTRHSFEYYNEVQTASGSYQPLSASEEWTPQNDDVKAGFLNPIPLFNDKASMLGGNKSFGGGFGMAITVGPFDGNLAMKSNTAGVSFGFNYSRNEGMLALVDINGDGLIDKVYKKDGKLYFRPNQSGPAGSTTFGPIRNIIGINDFNKGESFIGDVGLESHFGIFAGFEYTRTEDITSIYFSDVNGDQLMDIVKDGKAYFNHLDGAGIPHFTTSSEDTPSPINAAAGIDPALVVNDTQALAAAIRDNPLHDIVRVWVAPFNGTVSITESVTLREDTSDEAESYIADDGVRVVIQHRGNELWSSMIAANDFTPKTPVGVSNIPVQKGEKIYFRVQSKFNGAYDQVLWTPEITYTNHTAMLADANGLPPYQFKADKDFLLSTNGSTGMTIGGQIRITGNFVKPATSDDVMIRIQKKSNDVFTTLLQQTVSWNQAANIPISITHNVNKGDALYFTVSSATNIDWTALQWNPYVYFISSTDPAITQLFDSNNNPLLYTYPTVDFQSFNRTIRPTLPWVAPVTDTFTIQANPAFNFTFLSGELLFSIKKQNQLISKQVIPVTLGIPGSPPPITLILNSGEKLFFEYHAKDQQIANAISSPVTIVDANPGDPENFISGLHTLDTSFIFGPLYRHWGQFAYNGNGDRADLPIIETDLKLDDTYTDPAPDTIDLSTASNAGEMQTMYDAAGGNQPKDDKFIYLVPNNEKKCWIGYDNLTYVKKDTISSSRMGKDNLQPVNPIANSSPGTGSGAAGITKVSTTDNFSFAVGIGPAGVSASLGYTNFQYDFTDINGDRYPDILSTNKIQYTHPFGGLEDTARKFTFGDVSKAGHASVGFTLGGTFLKSSAPNARSTPRGAKATKAGSQAELSAGISGNFNSNWDTTVFAWMDINADDLPDRVYSDGKVALNLGYSFLPAEQWGYEGISEGFAISYGAGLSINIGNYSISAGVGLSRTESETNKTLLDVNGDGLLDYISGIAPLRVAINKGNGFAPPIVWSGADSLYKGISTGESVNGAFTIGIPIIPVAPVVKLCINPSFNISQGADRTRIQFDDIDGDGFPDFLKSDEDNKLSVSRSVIRRTNKLRKINRPMGSYFTLDYKRVGNNYQMPNSVWTLASVDIYDGVPGDGADRMRNTFEYVNGRFDRNEREFYGFGKVITSNHDTENGDEVYRKMEDEYINDNFYEKGLVKSEVIKDAAGRKFTETIYAYDLKNIHNGTSLPNSIRQSDDGMAFPALVSTQELYYEGQATAGKSTTMTNAYDALGNLVSFTDFGDAGSTDDITNTLSYHSVPAKYIMNIPSSVTVTGSGIIYRQRATSIDNNTGNITETRQYLQSGDVAKHNMEYDVYGNLTKVIRPENATGQRLANTYQYDEEVQIYLTRSSDSYGYSSSATYDVRFGQMLSQTDINVQKTFYTYDNAGRISTIRGPFEIVAGQPFTYSFEYHPEAVVPWALTKHYDPDHPTNFIETATFSDGFGRIVQSKKDGALFSGPQTADQEVMLVSGEDRYDAFGRTVTMYHPINEPKGTTGVLNPNEDNISPTRVTFDVLDRVLSTTLPDLTVNTFEYGFGTDRDGILQFKAKMVDGNGISQERFTNVRELLKATKEQYRQGSDVWTSYEYNPVDEVIMVTDDHGNKIISTYDRMGRRTSVNHPDNGLTRYQYDLNDNLTQLITANLQGSTGIKYNYDHERLVKIIYPQNPQNNVMLAYGAPGASSFGAGRVIKQQDLTGTQEFFHNPLGAVVKNKRVINVPGNEPFTYTTEWTYDSWNRLTGMLYPDGERLTYNYNLGGTLEKMAGIKSGTSYNYLPRMGYDKFEQRVYTKYGNGTVMTRTYEPGRRRLQNLTAKTAANRLMMDNTYSYDNEDNILKIVNNAPVPSSNLMGGRSDYQYTYDDLYRLTNAVGKYNGSNHEHRYNLTMKYNSISGIIYKRQMHERKGYDELTWALRNQTSYEYDYNYDPQTKPHAPVHIGEKAFTFDANGNQTGWDHEVSAQNRRIEWDEENRMKSLSDNGEIFRYAYDASGKRVLKNSGEGQTVNVNGKQVGQTGGLGNYTIYVNPYMEVRSGGFTKHFYIDGERIASKLGESGKGNGGNGNGGGGNGNNQEAFQFYYHLDHLGNSAFITNRLGEVYQHLEYFPFGEAFIEEHGNQERTAYLYNSKELDEESGLYYYGSRYYDSRTSVWESSDPLWELPDEVNKSPYAYVVNNPVTYYDYDGRGKINMTAKAAAYMTRPFDISESPAAQKRAPGSGVREYDVASFGIVQRLEQVGDNLTGDHQPSGAAIKLALRLALHLNLNHPLTRGKLGNAYRRAVTIVVTDKWHKSQSRTYGGRNTPSQISGDAADLDAAARADWKRLSVHLKLQKISKPQRRAIKRRLNLAQVRFFKTGRIQFDPK